MSHDSKLIAKAIEHLPATFRNCHQIAVALIDTKRPIVRQTLWSKLGNMTDYEKARLRSLDAILSIIERLQQITDEDLRPDIIRATAHLGQITEKCRNCPQVNLHNLADGRPFVCLADNQSKASPSNKFRFRLDSRGRIVESH